MEMARNVTMIRANFGKHLTISNKHQFLYNANMLKNLVGFDLDWCTVYTCIIKLDGGGRDKINLYMVG